MKKPSNNSMCTVCPHKNKKDGEEEYSDDEIINNESKVQIKRKKNKKKDNKKRGPLKVNSMNKNIYIRLEQKRNATQQVLKKRNNLQKAFAAIRRFQSSTNKKPEIKPTSEKESTNEKESTIAIRSNNHYYGIDQYTDVSNPIIGDTFCNIVTGETYLFNKDIWNRIPNPGPRAYYGENMTKEELVINPLEGDIFFQNDEISIYQNGQWITKNISSELSNHQSSSSNSDLIGEDKQSDSVSYGTSCHSDEEEDDSSSDQQENSLSYDEENSQNEELLEINHQIETTNTQETIKTMETPEDKLETIETSEDKIETMETSEDKIETMETPENQRIVPKLNMENIDKIYTFMVDEHKIEGKYCNINQVNYEKLEPIENNKMISMQITPQGKLCISIKFNELRKSPIRVSIENWIKYSDNDKKIWQTVNCISDITMINGDNTNEKYSIISENPENMKQMQKTYTTIGIKDKLIIKPEEEITEITFQAKLLAYPLSKTEKSDFYLVEFTDSNSIINLPIITIEI